MYLVYLIIVIIMWVAERLEYIVLLMILGLIAWAIIEITDRMDRG